MAAYVWEELCDEHNSPGPVSRHCLAYNRSAKATVLFSGINWETNHLLPQTWELRRGRWNCQTTHRAPSPRHRAAMTYDPLREACVLFGGQTRSLSGWPMLDDTWFYTKGEWKRWNRWWGVHPSARCGHMLTFDETLGETVLFGGIGATGHSLADTWSFNGERWQKWAITGPEPRRYSAFAYHPLLKGCVLNAGAFDDHGQRLYTDTWIFRAGEWKPARLTFKSPERDDHVLAWHEKTAALLLFGGLRDAPDLMQFTRTGWREVDGTEGLMHRQCAPAVYDPGAGGLVSHGGEVAHGGPNFATTSVLRAIVDDHSDPT